MKYILVLYFLSGETVLDSPAVKAFETQNQCEAFIEKEGMKKMDIYIKYYRENKDKMKGDELQLTLKCHRILPNYLV